MKNRLRIKIFLCLMISTIIISCKQEIVVKDDVSIESNDTMQSNFSNKSKEKFDFLPTSTSHQIVVHDNFTLSYVEDKEQAEWVAYELKRNTSHYQNFERPFFIEDVKVSSGSADWRNYKKSGYDKGHLCAAADMKFSKKAFDETFLTSNIAPQKHDFNEGIWNTLEQKVRYWSSKYDGIYVVTGGVLSGNLKTIGKEKVAVPDCFYKVLLDDSRGEYKMIGFLVPAVDSDQPLYEFVVPVDQIEKMTGIDFFPKLNDAIENKLEKANDYKGWSF